MGEPSPPQSPLIGRIVLVSTAVVKEFGEGLAKNYFVTDEFFFSASLAESCENGKSLLSLQAERKKHGLWEKN